MTQHIAHTACASNAHTHITVHAAQYTQYITCLACNRRHAANTYSMQQTQHAYMFNT